MSSDNHLTVNQCATLLACRHKPTILDPRTPNGVKRSLIIKGLLREETPGKYLTTNAGIQVLHQMHSEIRNFVRWATQ